MQSLLFSSSLQAHLSWNCNRRNERVIQGVLEKGCLCSEKRVTGAKKSQLEKQCTHSAKWLHNETEEEANLRREKVRIRQKIRHLNKKGGIKEEIEEEICSLENQLYALAAYPKLKPLGWWSFETQEKYAQRLKAERLRQEKYRNEKKEKKKKQWYLNQKD